MKKFCIIGGFGNIGLGVTRELLRQGNDITVVTRPRSGENPLPGTRWIQINRRNQAGFKNALKDLGIEYVIDFACHSVEDAEMDYETFPNVKHLLMISSGASYGPLYGNMQPIRETMIQQPNWLYGVSKKAAEEFLLEKFRREGYPVTVFRPSVCYGRQSILPRQIGMDNSWIDRIRKGKPIVTGNPYILRNFLFADDAVGACVGVFNHSWCIGQVYNLGPNRTSDWGEYHRAMMAVCGREVEMVEVPLKTLQASTDFTVSEMVTESYVYNAMYSCEKIARDIPEFCPSTDLVTGLAKAVEFLDQKNLVPNSDEFTWEDELIAAQNQSIVYLNNLSK